MGRVAPERAGTLTLVGVDSAVCMGPVGASLQGQNQSQSRQLRAPRRSFVRAICVATKDHRKICADRDRGINRRNRRPGADVAAHH
jgi:hypothetical protein